MAYITVEQLNDWYDNRGALNPEIAESLCDAASKAVDDYCGRTFVADSVASARVFFADAPDVVTINDALQITAVATDDAGAGTYSTSWSASDWFATPINNIGPNGQANWPSTAIVARLTRWFTVSAWPSVQVTAKWGWAAVPAEVTQACLMLAAEMFASKDAPLGITATDLGGVQVRGNLRVRALLDPFKTSTDASGKFLVW